MSKGVLILVRWYTTSGWRGRRRGNDLCPNRRVSRVGREDRWAEDVSPKD